MKYRNDLPEIMDDFSLDTDALKESLNEIAWINRLLGGNRPVLKAVKRLSKKREGIVRIADMGCGNGDMLRAIADMARKENRKVVLHGIDANQATVAYAGKLSEGYPEIRYSCLDILQPDFENEPYDIVLFTLTLHHFSDKDIVGLLKKVMRGTSIGIVVNDLQRSKWAYRLFGLLCSIAGLGDISANDGKISILRGFRRKELEIFSKALQPSSYTIRWQWAFRYQWIIYRQ